MDKIDIPTVHLMQHAMEEKYKHHKIKSFEYEGVFFTDGLIQTSRLEQIKTMEGKKDDVFIVTYPKAGTTWTQNMMYPLLHGGDVTKPLKTHAMFQVPYIEANFSPPTLNWQHPLSSLKIVWYLLRVMVRLMWINILQGSFSFLPPSPGDMIESMPSPRFLKSHLPAHLLPRDIFDKKVKIVYVARNPKDLAVSYFHFSNTQDQLPHWDSWDEFIEAFMAGKVTYGNWYDHYLSFWRRRHEDNILFIKYEDMKKDEKAAVQQISEFLGYHYSDDIIERIADHCTFNKMKKNPMANPDTLFHKVKKTSFMRKGQVGDWRNHFTDAQNKSMNDIYEEKLKGTGLEFDFD